MVRQNIILTGIPRSGTTLACHLLNQLPNALALVEPMNISELLEQPSAALRTDYINSFFANIRQQVLNEGQVEANVVAGEGTNTFNSEDSGARKPSLISKGVIGLTGQYKADFKLIVKHPNAFSALLPELTGSFSCYAIIRNPLSVLASWHSLDHPLSKGHAPMAEAFDDELRQTLNEEPDDLERQLLLLNWYYQQYAKYLNANNIIRYEDVISSNGTVLQSIHPAAVDLREGLTSRNSNVLYDTDFILQALERLKLNERHSCWDFYTASELEAVYNQAIAYSR